MGGRPEAWRWLPLFDFTILPSLFEGLPLAALESMAAGRAVIGALACGTVDAIRHGETGLLVEPRDPGALADGILRALGDPALRARLAAGARARALERFTWRATATGTVENYRALLAERESAARAC